MTYNHYLSHHVIGEGTICGMESKTEGHENVLKGVIYLLSSAVQQERDVGDVINVFRGREIVERQCICGYDIMICVN